MAIPTMFHSSSSILEASGMAYLAEDTPTLDTDGHPDPTIQTETAALTTAQRDGEQWLEFSPSGVEHRLPQSQQSSRSPVTLRSTRYATPSIRTQHRGRAGDGRERRKKTNILGQWRWRDRPVKKSLNRDEERTQRATPPIFTKPEGSTNSISQRTVKVCSEPDYESQKQGTTLALGFTHQRHYLGYQRAGLCLHRLEVDCCLDIYSSNGRSCSGEVHSNLESAYIYAESIKGCDSCCSMLQECNSVHPCADVPQMSFDVMTQNEDVCYETGEMKRDDGNAKALCMYAEDELSFDFPGYSTEAVVGSDYSGGSSEGELDLDNALIYAAWEPSFDSGGTDASLDSLEGLTEAQWESTLPRLSSGSDASCYTLDCGSDCSYCTVERSGNSEFEGTFSAHHRNLPSDNFDESSYDLYNAWTESSDMVHDGYQEKNNGMDSFCLKDYSVNELRGTVTQTDHSHFSTFFREMVKEAAQDKDQEKLNVSEGFLFHPRKIPLCSFSWEEVATWSRLDSPRVLQLYGAVREGLNVVLFMDLKTGSLAQLLRAYGSLSENLALYYHSQVLQALVHLHSRQVIHLDVKVDNVLLSKDGRQCFLCDFGLSEMLDQSGCSTKTFRGNGLRGTESHMSPEVARGDPRSDKADVWSSCCMLLHMLSGHQPWTRFYTHPLCLKIVSEPAPLWEIPPGCDPLTCEIIRAGLVKEPRERDTAKELLEKTAKALRTVGGLSDLVLYHLSTPEIQKCPPMILQETPSLVTVTTRDVSAPISSDQEEPATPRIQWVSTWRERAEEEDSDPEGRALEEANKWSNKGRMSDVRRKEAWMEKLWETEEDSVTTSNKHLPLSEEDEEMDDDLYTDVKKGWNRDEDQEEHGESSDESDSEEGDDSNDATDGGLYEGHTGGSVDEVDRVTDGDCGGEQVESDLESLRELGSDWTEEEWEPFQRLQILYGSKAQRNSYLQSNDDDEEESLASTMPSSSLGGQEMALSEQNSKLTLICHRSTCASEPELTDKNSDWSDDLSSGVFSSFSSLTDGQSFNVDWSVSTNQPPSCCFEGLGVDIWVEDVSGETLRIRERLKVKLGHVAVGISAQISMRTFSLATLDGKLVSPDMEVLESGLWLQCVPAPDGSTTWGWRVRDGKLEKQDHEDGASDTCSTLAA